MLVRNHDFIPPNHVLKTLTLVGATDCLAPPLRLPSSPPAQNPCGGFEIVGGD